MQPQQLFEPVQRLFDTAKAQNRTFVRTRFIFVKWLVAKTNLAPVDPISAADLEAVASTDGQLSTFRLFMLQPLPEQGSNIYRGIMVMQLFKDQPPEIMDGIYEVDVQAGTSKSRTDLASAVPASSGQEVAQTIILPFLQATQILDGDSPHQSILNMLLTDR